MKISIAKDFSITPGGRYIKEGQFSGEEFRESMLIPKFLEATKNNEKLIIDTDGAYGYPPSFLDESFGGLADTFGIDAVLSRIEIVANDQPGLVDRISGYVHSHQKYQK